jgi:hypothetical protein
MLLSTPDDATPEKVLSDTFARLDYLPDEAKQAASKILPQKPLDVRREPTEVDVVQARRDWSHDHDQG